jgi:hypothetical protein
MFDKVMYALDNSDMPLITAVSFIILIMNTQRLTACIAETVLPYWIWN